MAHGKKIMLKLAGIDTPEAAMALCRQKLWVDCHDIALEDDEFLWRDLIGMVVISDAAASVPGTTGKASGLLGKVVGVQSFGAQDILCVRNEAGEWMLPFIEDVILAVDEENRCIRVHLQEGMDACFTPSC